MSAPHIVVVGAGGVGCWITALIAAAAQKDPSLARVTLVARGKSLDRVKANGLEYSVKFSPNAGGGGEGDDPGSIRLEPGLLEAEPTCAAILERGGVADYVVLCVKTWQVADASRDAAPLLRQGSGCIVTTQNGVSATREAQVASADGAVLGGSAKVIVFREEGEEGPLKCVRMGFPSPRILKVGELTSRPSERVVRLRTILEAAGISSPVPDDDNIQQEMWRKAVMMCSMGPLCALCRTDIHTLVRNPASRQLFLSAMEEVCALSKQIDGCYVGNGYAQTVLANLENLKPGSCPSTVRDVVCGRPSEIRELSGALHKLGQELGVPTPVHSMVAAALEPQEALARGECSYSLEGVPGGKPSVSST